jgi:hypothetical protein
MGELSPAISRIWPCLRAAGGCERCRAENSFCVALWEGLHGELPFPASSLAGLRSAVLAGRPREPADTRGVPGWIRSVLDRGLARDPAARYPSMSALVRDLDRDPALSRRRALAVGTMLVVAIGAGLGLAELRARDAPPSCVTVEEASAAMWSATRREQTRRGVFAAAGSARGRDLVAARAAPRRPRTRDRHDA